MKRREYLAALQQETQEHGKKPVYLDESGFRETDFRRYAYAPRGVRVEDSEMLCPLLDDTHVLIMDNASFHKGSETAALIRDSGASLLFLPPYSPELNPIEKDFANIKRIRQYNAETSIDDIIKVYN